MVVRQHKQQHEMNAKLYPSTYRKLTSTVLCDKARILTTTLRRKDHNTPWRHRPPRQNQEVKGKLSARNQPLLKV